MRRLRDKRVASVPVSVVMLLIAAAGALAYFTAAGVGSAASSIASLSAAGNPAASSSGASASVTWTASTISGSVPATNYTVERYDTSGNDLGAASCGPVLASSGNPNAFGNFTCTDSPSPGTYKYRIGAHYNSSWTTTTGFTNLTTTKNATITTAAAPATGTAATAIAASAISATLSGAASECRGPSARKNPRSSG